MWESLAKKLDIQLPVVNTEVLIPSMADIEEFESKNDFPLPDSYKAFITELGYGTLNSFFDLHAPVKSRAKDFTSMFGKDQARGNQLLKDIYGDEAFIDRMIPFGGTAGADTIAWDPLDVTRKKPRDYGIYVLPRSARKIVKLTTTFRKFVMNTCFGRDFEDVVVGYRDPDWETEWVFEPVWKRTPRRK